MEHENKEQVVFVKDLLFAALYQWRRILAAALVFALLFGCATFLSLQKKASAVPSGEEAQAVMDEYSRQKLLLEKMAENAQNLVSSQEAYQMESTLMHLDPYAVYKATIELTVQAQTDPDTLYSGIDTVSPYLHAYAVYLRSDPVMNAIADAVGLKSKYLTELIGLVDGGATTRSLSVTVSYPTAEGAQQILTMLMDALEDAQAPIRQSIGEHTVSIVTSGVGECIDLAIIELQNAAVKRLDTLRTQLSSVQTKLSSLKAPSLSSQISTKRIVIFAILGAILGAGLVACAAWICHIADGRVYSARVLRNKTCVRVLGCVPMRKRGPVDRWLRKLEGRSTGEDCLDVAAATVRNYCTGIQNLMIVGSCDTESQEAVAQALKALGVQATACGSLLHSAEALNALPACDAALLVEKCGCSRYTHILQTMERIADQEKPLLGCVLLDG